jgi:hypothetical protein
MNRHLKRFLISGCISSVVVLIITLSVVLRYGKTTEGDRYIAYLFAPAVLMANKLHLLADPVLSFWAVTGGSLIFYAVMIWIVLSLWSWIRGGKLRQ